MSDPNNIFDRVDGVENKVDKVSSKMDNLASMLEKALTKNSNALDNNNLFVKENQQQVLRRFVRNSTKEYMWIGSFAEFYQGKRTSLILLLILMAVMFVATILTGVAIKTYTVFMFFENVWFIMLAYILIQVWRAQRFYECYQFSKTDCFKFETDADGILRMGALKKRYKILFSFNCISAIANVIYMWVKSGGAMAVVATIFEIAVVGLNIFVCYKVLDFFSGYAWLRFTGKNEMTGKRVALIYDPILNNLHEENDFFKKFSQFK